MLLGLLGSLDTTWYITAVIAIVTYFYVRHWQLRRVLPPGPTPLPIIGNIWAFRRKGTKVDHLFKEWRKRYGNILTIWAGSRPIVVVSGWDSIRDGLVVQKNAFSGRPSNITSETFLGENQDVILSDFGPAWEQLRKLAHSAVRKVVTSEHLPDLIDDIVKQCMKSMEKEKGPIDINLYLYLAVYNILATTAFGERYDINDKEFKKLVEANEQFSEDFGIGLPGDLFPYLRYLFYYFEHRFKKMIKLQNSVFLAKYKRHKDTYRKGVVRDFTDALLAAKEEAEKEDSRSAVHFSDGNLVLLINDLFGAGTDTTRLTMLWIMLYICNYPEVQEKIRKEVQENIGDRMPIQEDKYKCPYTIAVMTEVLRLQPVIRFTLEHKTSCDAQLGDFTIPKDTSLFFDIKSPQRNKEFWSDPDTFRPERFLNDEGKFTTERMEGYLPFGLGRRACPGEKMAKADIFLLLTRFLQLCRFSLPNGPGTGDLNDTNEFLINKPKYFTLCIQRIKN